MFSSETVYRENILPNKILPHTLPICSTQRHLNDFFQPRYTKQIKQKVSARCSKYLFDVSIMYI